MVQYRSRRMEILNKGISLISLIITIIVMIILTSLVVFGSLETIQDANLTRKRNEFAEVCTFVRGISTKAEADLIELNLTSGTLATPSQISDFYVDEVETDLSSSDAQKIEAINVSVRESGRNPKYGYHYITAKQIENSTIPGIEANSNMEKVQNDYIINFYYGVIITKISDTEVSVSGIIR